MKVEQTNHRDAGAVLSSLPHILPASERRGANKLSDRSYTSPNQSDRKPSNAPSPVERAVKITTFIGIRTLSK
jgi:hypothetical protein